MGSTVVYIMEWAFALLLFLAVYKICFSGTTLHRFNRCYLLIATVLSAILPLVRLTVPETQVVPIHDTTFAHTLQEVTIYGGSDALPAGTSASDSVWAWILAGCWSIYVIVLLTGWTRSIIRTARFMKGKTVHRLGHIRVVSHDEQYGPFSWMNCIVISNCEDGFARRASMRHELSHIRLGHYFDLVFLLACTVVNPVCWLIMKEIKIVHEYEADDEVISRYGIAERDYQRLLIMRTVGAEAYALASSFNLNIKQRIIMMMKEKTMKRRMLYLLAIIPVIGLMSLLCANNANAAGLQSETGSDDTDNENVINILIDRGISYQMPDSEPADAFIRVGDVKELGRIIKDRNISKAIIAIGENEKLETLFEVKDILRENNGLNIVYQSVLGTPLLDAIAQNLGQELEKDSEGYAMINGRRITKVLVNGKEEAPADF